jgi:hypothetical protein
MRAPVDDVQVTRHGAYGYVRTDTDLCPGKGTCTHYGVDLAGDITTEVFAPESGIVVVSRPVRYKRPDKPFTGYHPAVVLMHGDSGTWHLLAHLRPSSLAFLQMPDDYARRARLDLRDTLIKVGDGERIAFGPFAKWVSGERVDEGAFLGTLAGLHPDAAGNFTLGHVHWETRLGPLGSGASGTMDPFEWLGLLDPTAMMRPRRSGGGAGFLLVAALFFFAARKSR